MADETPEAAWEAERQRLQLVVACAVRMLIAHMGTDSFYMPFEGEILLIQKVRQR